MFVHYLYICVCVCASDQTQLNWLVNGSKSTVLGALRVNIAKRSKWLTVIFMMHPPNLQTHVYVLQIYDQC